MHGRGTVDMKAGVVAMLAAARAVRTAGLELERSFALHLVVGEEDGGLGAFGTLAFMVAFLVRFRKGRVGNKTNRVEVPLALEIGFVVVPLVIFLVWFQVGFKQYVRLSTPPKDATDVYVMGKKWMWKFAYPQGPNGLDLARFARERCSDIRVVIASGHITKAVSRLGEDEDFATISKPYSGEQAIAAVTSALTSTAESKPAHRL